MKKDKIAIIGLGYVGLPLARLFATKYSVIGFDIKSSRKCKLWQKQITHLPSQPLCDVELAA